MTIMMKQMNHHHQPRHHQRLSASRCRTLTTMRTPPCMLSSIMLLCSLATSLFILTSSSSYYTIITPASCVSVASSYPSAPLTDFINSGSWSSAPLPLYTAYISSADVPLIQDILSPDLFYLASQSGGVQQYSRLTTNITNFYHSTQQTNTQTRTELVQDETTGKIYLSSDALYRLDMSDPTNLTLIHIIPEMVSSPLYSTIILTMQVASDRMYLQYSPSSGVTNTILVVYDLLTQTVIPTHDEASKCNITTALSNGYAFGTNHLIPEEKMLILPCNSAGLLIYNTSSLLTQPQQLIIPGCQVSAVKYDAVMKRYYVVCRVASGTTITPGLWLYDPNYVSGGTSSSTSTSSSSAASTSNMTLVVSQSTCDLYRMFWYATPVQSLYVICRAQLYLSIQNTRVTVLFSSVNIVSSILAILPDRTNIENTYLAGQSGLSLLRGRSKVELVALNQCIGLKKFAVLSGGRIFMTCSTFTNDYGERTDNVVLSLQGGVHTVVEELLGLCGTQQWADIDIQKSTELLFLVCKTQPFLYEYNYRTRNITKIAWESGCKVSLYQSMKVWNDDSVIIFCIGKPSIRLSRLNQDVSPPAIQPLFVTNLSANVKGVIIDDSTTVGMEGNKTDMTMMKQQQQQQRRRRMLLPLVSGLLEIPLYLILNYTQEQYIQNNYTFPPPLTELNASLIIRTPTPDTYCQNVGDVNINQETNELWFICRAKLFQGGDYDGTSIGRMNLSEIVPIEQRTLIGYNFTTTYLVTYAMEVAHSETFTFLFPLQKLFLDKSDNNGLGVTVVDLNTGVRSNINFDGCINSPTVQIDQLTGIAYAACSNGILTAIGLQYRCSPGQVWISGTCTSCRPGSVSIATNILNPILPVCTSCSLGSIAPAAGMLSCQACSVGRYDDQKQFEVCSACASGTYQNKTGQPACNPCDRGSYADTPGMTDCIKCQPGTFAALPQSQVCSVCQTGSSQSSYGASTCDSCVPGRYASDVRWTSCLECQAGEYASKPGQTTCTMCSRNSASNITGRTTECPDCAPGTEQLALGGIECTRCSLGRSTSAGGLCADCSLGTYTPQHASSCISCNGDNQEGLLCSGGLATVQEGWFPYLVNETVSGELIEIYHTTRCPAGFCSGAILQWRNSTTTMNGITIDLSSPPITPICTFPREDASDNWLCGRCVEGYIPWNDSCDKCDQVNGGLIVLIIIVGFVLVIFFLRSGTSSAGHLAVLIFFVQTSALELTSVSSWLQWLQWTNLSAQSTKSCLGPIQPLDQILLTFFTPFILCGALVIVGIIHYSLYRHHLMKNPHLAGDGSSSPRASTRTSIFSKAAVQRQLTSIVTQFTLSQYVGAVMSILLFCYTSVCVAVIRSLHCVNVAPNTTLLFDMPTVDCSSDEYKRYFPVIILWLIVYIIGFPVCMMIFLTRHHRRLMHSSVSQMSDFELRWGPFYRGYNSNAWYWQPLLLVRRLGLVLVSVLLTTNISRYTAFIAIHFFSFMLHLLARPFHSKELNMVESVAYSLLIYVSLILVASSPPYSVGIQVLLFLLVVPPGIALVIWCGRYHYIKLIHAQRKKQPTHIGGIPLTETMTNNGNGNGNGTESDKKENGSNGTIAFPASAATSSKQLVIDGNGVSSSSHAPPPIPATTVKRLSASPFDSNGSSGDVTDATSPLASPSVTRGRTSGIDVNSNELLTTIEEVIPHTRQRDGNGASPLMNAQSMSPPHRSYEL